MLEPLEMLYAADSPMRNIHGEYTKWLDYQSGDYVARARELDARTYPHMPQLAAILGSQQERFGSLSADMSRKLEALGNGEAYAMVTGQQVGIFGGPLFAVYKLLTVIKEAKRAERTIGKPVVPVFWMASEDHDYAEINHVYMKQPFSRVLRKESLPLLPLAGKAPVSDLDFQMIKPELHQMLRELLRSETETGMTGLVYETFARLIEESRDFTEFFGRVMRACVGNEFLLFDAHAPEVRQLEIPFFSELVRRNDDLSAAFADSARPGMPAVELNREAAHVFYQDGGRELLLKEGDFFTTKRGHRFTEKELLELIQLHPERFSNNVVSRPLMQDYLFPTIGYVAGPGEISYWLQLRPLFHVFDWKMPILTPRLGAVLLSVSEEKKLSQEGTTLSAYLQAPLPDHQFDEEAYDERLYAFRNLTGALATEARLQGSKFESKVKTQLERIMSDMRADAKRQFHRHNHRRIELATHLCPMSAPQERMWTVVPFLNRHGMDVMKRLAHAYEASEYETLVARL